MDFLTQIDRASFDMVMLVWVVLCIVSAVAMHTAGLMPMSNRQQRSGLMLLGTIDKRTGWIILETPVLITVVYFYLAGLESSGEAMNWSALFVAAFFLHYFHRALIYPYRIKVQGKRMSVLIMLCAMSFYIINGYIIGYYFGAFGAYEASWLSDPRFIIGMALFVSGMAINIHSDNLLINLRKPGETEYKLPRGGFFRWVSCPNYFGEMVEWIGFAIMSWSVVGLVFSLWIALPLMAQGYNAHRWYRQQFSADYPAQRKAIIPYLL